MKMHYFFFTEENGLSLPTVGILHPTSGNGSPRHGKDLEDKCLQLRNPSLFPRFTVCTLEKW